MQDLFTGLLERGKSERIEMHAGFWLENLTQEGNLANLGIEGRIMLTLILLTWRIW